MCVCVFLPFFYSSIFLSLYWSIFFFLITQNLITANHFTIKYDFFPTLNAYCRYIVEVFMQIMPWNTIETTILIYSRNRKMPTSTTFNHWRNTPIAIYIDSIVLNQLRIRPTIQRLNLSKKGETSAKKGCPEHGIKLHPVVRLQFWNNPSLSLLQVPFWSEAFGFGLVSLFNDISTFVSYLQPNPSL